MVNKNKEKLKDPMYILFLKIVMRGHFCPKVAVINKNIKRATWISWWSPR